MIDMKLDEATRNQLIAKSKSSEKGKQRFDRRSKSKVQNTTSAMNKIDMNKLFTEDILTVGVPVKGETDDYTVTVSVSGILELLQDEVKRSGSVSFREVARATINAFNKEDVYISCSCPDFSYRFGLFAINTFFFCPAEKSSIFFSNCIREKSIFRKIALNKLSSTRLASANSMIPHLFI